MSRFLLDTNVISEPMRGRPDPQVVRQIETLAEECCLCAPVWHELVQGVELLEPSKKRRTLETYLAEVVRASFPILPYDEQAAHWHGQERARLRRIGREPPFVDGQIAAITRVHQLTLVTRNVRDFRTFEGLEVVSWFS